MRYSNKYLVIFNLSRFSISFFYQIRSTYQHIVPTISQPEMCADLDATTHLFSYGDFSDKISSLANLMKTSPPQVAILNDQNTFLVVKCLRLPFRSVGSGWQWISEGLNGVRFLFKFVT